MNAIHEGVRLDRLSPRRHVMATLHQELLTVRQMLLRYAGRWVPSKTRQARPEDTVDEWERERAYATIREVEWALESMIDKSFGICRGCHRDIPAQRLFAHPRALLCAACVEERLEHLAADAL